MRPVALILSLLLGCHLSAGPASAGDWAESLKAGFPAQEALGEFPDTSGLDLGRDLKGLNARSFSAAGLHVYFVDVGQGDAEYIVLPNGENVLIDGGPSGARIAAFLEQMGVSEIEHVVLTHPHSDHYQGLNHVFDELQVNNFYDTGIDNMGAAGDNALRRKAAEEPDCTIHYPAPAETLDWGSGVGARVLSSCPQSAEVSGDTAGGIVVNNCSMVIRLSAPGFSVLFTGDIQERTEELLIEYYGSGLASDILKVPHHGSEESATPEFLALVRPTYAVIEVGRNSYGLPTQVALDRLAEVGAKVYRTDVDGSLLFRDKPSSLYVMNIPH
ncbi:ComEC/Rec2 family competence protein [Elusimicrobiota bacterium]